MRLRVPPTVSVDKSMSVYARFRSQFLITGCEEILPFDQLQGLPHPSGRLTLKS